MGKLAKDSRSLRKSLLGLGLSETAINAAWPQWWNESANDSESAKVELNFSLARKLGVDPKSLIAEVPAKFIWEDEAKFKNITTETLQERAAITSFGVSVSRIILEASAQFESLDGVSAKTLRESILRNQVFVRLVDLLGLCWGVGIPVVHLRVFPLAAKHMCAMATRISDRYAILLAKDSIYPAPISYYLAHEIAHVALGHIKEGDDAIVDLSDPLDRADKLDREEIEADRFALELLTGRSEPTIATETSSYTAKQLAENLLATANGVRIEPGTLALCFGHSTGNWPKAYAAMKFIYDRTLPAWQVVNTTAANQLDWQKLPGDLSLFLQAVIGMPNGSPSQS